MPFAETSPDAGQNEPMQNVDQAASTYGPVAHRVPNL